MNSKDQKFLGGTQQLIKLIKLMELMELMELIKKIYVSRSVEV